MHSCRHDSNVVWRAICSCRQSPSPSSKCCQLCLTCTMQVLPLTSSSCRCEVAGERLRIAIRWEGRGGGGGGGNGVLDGTVQVERTCVLRDASGQGARDLLLGGDGCRLANVSKSPPQPPPPPPPPPPPHIITLPLSGSSSMIEMTVFTQGDAPQHINREYASSSSSDCRKRS